MPINVVLADNHKMIRDVLKYRLEADHDIKVVGDTDNGYECLSLVNKNNPNVVIMDTCLRSLDGFKVFGIMREQSLYNKVLFLADSDNSDNLMKAVDMGCDAYLTKDGDFAELKKAIYSVYRGDTYIQENLRQVLINRNSAVKKNEKIANLTKRELDILKLLAEGLTNKEISETFKISDRTVKNHIFSLFRKIQVNDRTQAAVYAIKNGIVDITK